MLTFVNFSPLCVFKDLLKGMLQRTSRAKFSLESPPGHAAVDGKVDWVGEADEHIDEEDDLADHLVVKKLHQAGIRESSKENLARQKPIM